MKSKRTIWGKPRNKKQEKAEETTAALLRKKWKEMSFIDWTWGDTNHLKAIMELARNCSAPFLEFGTFRGRTSYCLAQLGELYTIDYPCEKVESNLHQRTYPAYTPGELFKDTPLEKNIHLIIKDSTKIDFAPFFEKFGFIFVDGGHSFEVCLSDSINAINCVKKDGIIVWDDYYGSWPGVRRALDKLKEYHKLEHIDNLVIYKKTSNLYRFKYDK